MFVETVGEQYEIAQGEQAPVVRLFCTRCRCLCRHITSELFDVDANVAPVQESHLV